MREMAVILVSIALSATVSYFISQDASYNSEIEIRSLKHEIAKMNLDARLADIRYECMATKNTRDDLQNEINIVSNEVSRNTLDIDAIINVLNGMKRKHK